MADPVTDTIGFVSGVLGIVSFFQSLFPTAPSTPVGTVVRIKAGLGDDSSSGLGGKITAVYGFDSNNDYLGNSGSGSMGAGDTVDLTISQQDPGRRGDYISVANSDNAVCIDWITVTQYDGSRGGAWTGDIGKNCGQHWYYGKQLAGHLKSGGDYVPYCTWLDGDATNGIPSASLKFTTDAYGDNVQDTQDSGDQCSATIFSAATGPIADKPSGLVDTSTRRKRSSNQRSANLDNQLVVSNFTSHTAEELCSSDTAYGPDFVGADNKFCDLSTKTLSPLCSVEDVDGCVDVKTNGTAAAVTRRSTVARRSMHVTKEYGKVIRYSP